jgi:chemosensory pili system protein ChpA (sensor histidine kinase/response regulator)
MSPWNPRRLKPAGRTCRRSSPAPPRRPLARRPRRGFRPAAQVQLRVRADLVDQLVNEAGEVAIARGRIEGELLALKGPCST